MWPCFPTAFLSVSIPLVYKSACVSACVSVICLSVCLCYLVFPLDMPACVSECLAFSACLHACLPACLPARPRLCVWHVLPGGSGCPFLPIRMSASLYGYLPACLRVCLLVSSVPERSPSSIAAGTARDSASSPDWRCLSTAIRSTVRDGKRQGERGKETQGGTETEKGGKETEKEVRRQRKGQGDRERGKRQQF